MLGACSNPGVRLVAVLIAVIAFAPAAFAGDDTYTGEPEVAAELFDEAEALREEGRWDGAATKYWEALDADLLHYRAHVRYQEAALAAGDSVDDMIEDYKSFIEDYPKVLDLRLHLLRITHDPGDRIPELEKVLVANKDNPNVNVEIGRARIASGDAAAALEPLTKALALCPATRTDVPLLLADAEYAAGKTEEARKRVVAMVQAKPEFFEAHLTLARFDLLEGENKDAVKRADQVLKLRPTFIGAFLIKAEAQDRLDLLEDALNTLVAARRVAPESNQVRLAYADLLSREEAGYEPALEIYADVLETDEENTHALFGAGWVLERQEKFEEAEEKYREVVAVDPSSAVAVNSVGYCLYKQGRITDAQVQFKKAADLDPDYASAVLNLGATYDVQAKYNDAIKIYEAFLKKNPNNLRALVNCAFDYEAIGSFPKSLTLLMRAHEIQPTDPLIVTWIGDNHYFQKKWKDAEKWYKTATTMQEESFFAWRGLGYTLGHMKRWEDAVKALEVAKRLDADDLDVYLALGDMYMNEIEDLDKALKNFQEYVQRGGTDPAIQDVIVELQKKLN